MAKSSNAGWLNVEKEPLQEAVLLVLSQQSFPFKQRSVMCKIM